MRRLPREINEAKEQRQSWADHFSRPTKKEAKCPHVAEDCLYPEKQFDQRNLDYWPRVALGEHWSFHDPTM